MWLARGCFFYRSTLFTVRPKTWPTFDCWVVFEVNRIMFWQIITISFDRFFSAHSFRQFEHIISTQKNEKDDSYVTSKGGEQNPMGGKNGIKCYRQWTIFQDVLLEPDWEHSCVTSQAIFLVNLCWLTIDQFDSQTPFCPTKVDRRWPQ